MFSHAATEFTKLLQPPNSPHGKDKDTTGQSGHNNSVSGLMKSKRCTVLDLKANDSRLGLVKAETLAKIAAQPETKCMSQTQFYS